METWRIVLWVLWYVTAGMAYVWSPIMAAYRLEQKAYVMLLRSKLDPAKPPSLWVNLVAVFVLGLAWPYFCGRDIWHGMKKVWEAIRHGR